MRIVKKSANRPGLSLAEVLVAMFVIAVGLLALLTLFPLGASQMAQAIKDDRTGHEAINASAAMRMVWKELFAGVVDTPKNWTTTEARFFAQAQENVNAAVEGGATPSPTGPSSPTMGSLTGPSFPVFVDPIGFLAPKNAGTKKWWVGGDQNLLLPRRTLPTRVLPAGNASAIRFCHLLDDMTFESNGEPQKEGGFVAREGRYSRMWMIQRPTTSTNWRETNLTVIVHSGRTIDNPFDETAYDGNVSGTQVTLSYSGNKPKIRKGGWVLLAKAPRVDWARAVSIDDTTPNVLRLDIQNQTKQVVGGCKVIAFECVSEVFFKDTLTPGRLPTVN